MKQKTKYNAGEHNLMLQLQELAKAEFNQKEKKIIEDYERKKVSIGIKIIGLAGIVLDIVVEDLK